MPTDTYQRHRHDETWTWSEDGPVVAFATHLDLDLPHADEAVLALNIHENLRALFADIEANAKTIRRLNFLTSDSVIGQLILGSTRQGSWAHRTIIKPAAGKNHEFDADFLFAAPKRSKTYKLMVVKKNRCVPINYGGDCHVDIVPHLILPGGNLRKVIRLVKYLRDSKDTFRIPSVILTALLGEQAQVYGTGNRYSGVPTTLVRLIEDLAAWPARTRASSSGRSSSVTPPSARFIEEMGVQWAGGRCARIEARVANPIGTGSVDLRQSGFAPVGRDLYFTVTTDAPQPYEIWWKVRNHGPDAESAHGLRGQITPGRGPRIRGLPPGAPGCGHVLVHRTSEASRVRAIPRCLQGPKVDRDREWRGGLHGAGEHLAVPVHLGGGVEDVGVDDGDTGGGVLDPPVEGDAGLGVLVDLHDPVCGLRAGRHHLDD